MSRAVRALAAVDGSDLAAAFDAIGDAVWAVTIVDAALVRYHPGAYDDQLAGETPTDRQNIERTLAGVRFVRNQIAGQADLSRLVEPRRVDPVAGGGVTDWTWKPTPGPQLTSRAPGARAWETARYCAYQSGLAYRSMAEIFARAEAFLLHVAATACLVTDAGVPGASPAVVAPRARGVRR